MLIEFMSWLQLKDIVYIWLFYSCLREGSERNLEFEDNSFQTENNVSLVVLQAFLNCVSPSSDMNAGVSYSGNLDVADKIAKASNNI